MAKVKITKKALYQRENKLLAYFKRPHFLIRKVQNKTKKLSFWDRYKEVLAPIGAIAGAFLLYVGTRGAMMAGELNGGGIGGSGGGSLLDGPGIIPPEQPSGTANTGSLIDLIIGFTNWLLPYVVVAAVIMIIYAGVLMVTAAGNDDQISKGKSIIIWTVIALFIVVSAYAIVNTVINFQ